MRTIPYGRQYIDNADIAEIAKVLRTDWITQGPKVGEFEDSLKRYCGAKYAVAVSSGTAALHMACLATDIDKDSEVITSPVTFVASANCILYCNAVPVFCDININTINMDSSNIIQKITRKTKALIPVHFAGQPCDMHEIYNIARKYNLIVIEDAAHALGASYNLKKIGSCSHSDMAIFSFHPVKSITTGEGGAILTNNRAFYKKLIALRSHGIVKDDKKLTDNYGPWYHEMRYLGFNYRMTDIQASLGITQLKKIDRFIEKRRRIALMYDKAFEGNSYFDTIKIDKSSQTSYHLYPIILKDALAAKRKEIFEALRFAGLGVQVHYIPVYLQPYYRKLGYKKGSCPVAEDYYSRTITIPLYPALKDQGVKKIIAILIKVMKKFGQR